MTQQLEAVSLFEVIASSPKKGPAFGVTFTDETTAQAYADRLTKAGYHVDPFPEYGTEATLSDALRSAAAHFKDDTLTT